MKTASWVVQDLETGEAVMETYNPKVAEAINLKKYKVTPILEYLQELNRRIRENRLLTKD